MKIGVIHATLGAAAPLNEAFKRLAPDAAVLNFVNEELLHRATALGGADAAGLRMFARTAFAAAEAEVDGIIVACSVYCPYVEQIKPFLQMPVIAIDHPMLETAAARGNKIGILTTNGPAAPAAQHQIEAMAATLGRRPEFVLSPIPAAAAAFQQGRREEGIERIRRAGTALAAQGCDTLVLAQITMACAAPALSGTGVTVLTSPDEGVRRILCLIQKP